jgi:hypothetical protein
VDSPNLSDAGRGAAKAPDHVEAMLDEALQATFPASDPIAVTIQPTKEKS